MDSGGAESLGRTGLGGLSPTESGITGLSFARILLIYWLCSCHGVAFTPSAASAASAAFAAFAAFLSNPPPFSFADDPLR